MGDVWPSVVQVVKALGLTGRKKPPRAEAAGHEQAEPAPALPLSCANGLTVGKCARSLEHANIVVSWCRIGRDNASRSKHCPWWWSAP